MSVPKVFFGRPIWAVFVFVGTVSMLVLFCWLLENPCWLLGKVKSPKQKSKVQTLWPTIFFVGQQDLLLGHREKSKVQQKSKVQKSQGPRVRKTSQNTPKPLKSKTSQKVKSPNLRPTDIFVGPTKILVGPTEKSKVQTQKSKVQTGGDQRPTGQNLRPTVRNLRPTGQTYSKTNKTKEMPKNLGGWTYKSKTL